MKAQTLLTKAAAGLSAAALTFAMAACSQHKLAEGQDYGQIRTEQAAAQQATPAQTVGTAPAPSNAQAVEGTTAPAVISGPAKVDNSGRAYTSSSVGSTGNASATGLNTNVNIIPGQPKSTVTVTEVPAPTPVITETTTVTTVETVPAPAPAPAVVETAPPMTSSTTVEQSETRVRMRKD